MTRKKDRQKFVELANKRVPRAIKAIELVSNLANRSNYDFTEKDVDHIMKQLNAALTKCKRRFDETAQKNDGGYIELK